MAEILALAVILLLVMAGYGAMVLMPRQRDFQKRQHMARSLSAGDEVITFGGIIGKVQEIEGDTGIAHIEIAGGVVVRVVTAAIMQRYDPAEIALNAQMGPDKTTTTVTTTPANDRA